MFVSGYVELHSHSAYSFLDGVSLPEDLVRRALELGYDSYALTDHDGVYGAMEFALAAKEQGLKAIHGAELTVVAGPRPVPSRLSSRPAEKGYGHGTRRRSLLDGWQVDEQTVKHITVLVKDAKGWANLCRLLTKAHSQTRDGKLRQRRDPWLTIADVCAHSEGLICLSGCSERGVEEPSTLKVLRDAFGREDLYIELQRRYLRGDKEKARHRLRLAKELGLRCVATGNVHSHSRERARLQDTFVAVHQLSTLDASEPLRRGNHTHVMASPQAMTNRFGDYPEAVAETVRLAARLDFDLTENLGYRYPGAEDTEAANKLQAVCEARFAERYSGAAHYELARGKMVDELALIGRLNLSGFFLLHHEILELAREVAFEVRGDSAARQPLPPGRGRGSSVSSIVCYLTGLSHVDPVVSKLKLARFLHDDVGASLPDIDLDFPRDIRAKLIPRVHERYGNERAALVAAFPTYRARGAIRELGAALGLPAAELERVARGSEGWSGSSVGEDISNSLKQKDLTGRWAILAELSKLAHGLPRHLSQHPGGMIISTRPLIDCCAVVPSAMAGRQMVMWDKDSCNDAGFLKIDLLGLGMLSCVERCVDLVAKTRRENIDLSRIPMDDPTTFSMIKKGDTIGVFQIESRAQIGSLLRTQPENIEDIAVQVAIVRPGPIQGGAVNPYIEARRRMREDPSFRPRYPHHSLEPVLEETLGTIIYQDQVIEAAVAFSGFSVGEAEGLRRAMSRKRSIEEIEKHRQKFVEGAMGNHPDVSEELAERVWQMVRGFSGFGFPKAHSVAFGLLAYQSTWLRAHYGPEFLCALMDEQPMGFYAPDALVHDAQRRGIKVLAPDIQKSQALCTMDADGAVRIGLGYVKGVVGEEIEALVAEREANGPWRSLADLTSRLGMGTSSLEKLAWAGVLDALVVLEGVPVASRRRAALWGVGALSSGKRVKGGTQLALELPAASQPQLAGMSAWHRMIADYATTSLTTKTHPLEMLRAQLSQRKAVTSTNLELMRHGDLVRVGGLVLARQRPASAKGMTFMLLEDETGTINLVVVPQIYERFRMLIRTEPLVVAEGRIEKPPTGGGQINIMVGRLLAMDDLVDTPGSAARASIRQLPRARTFDGPDAREAERQLPAVASAGGAAPAAGALFRKVAPEVIHFGRGRRR